MTESHLLNYGIYLNATKFWVTFNFLTLYFCSSLVTFNSHVQCCLFPKKKLHYLLALRVVHPAFAEIPKCEGKSRFILFHVSVAKVTTELFNEERSTAANGSGAVSQTLDYKNLKGLPVHETSNSSGIESGVLESSNQSSELSALDSTTSSQLPDIAALENIQFELDKLQDTVNSTDISEVETIVVTATSQGETSHSGDSLQEIPPGASLLTGTVSNSGQISAKSLLNTSGNTGSSIGSEATATVLPGQTLLKRPGAPGQVVTKVIITKNPGTVCGRTQAMQTGAAATGTSEIVLSAPATSQLLGVNTGTSITLTQANLLSSPTRLATATTPTKVILTSKSLTTGKSPTKIAIPINPQSPQRILQSGQFKIVSAQSVGGATSTVTPGGIQPKKLTFSPQKVIIRPQQPGATGVRFLFLLSSFFRAAGKSPKCDQPRSFAENLPGQ